MKYRQLLQLLGFSIVSLVIVFSSCRKINEATELGGDLIPPVDNITTFDTTITVEAYNDLFVLGGTDITKEDSTRSFFSNKQFVGKIDNDPLFGKTNAEMYFELKPGSYPFTFQNRPDSLFLDSIVLVLDYVDTYGDTLAPQTLAVSEITSAFRADTAYIVRKNTDVTTGGALAAPKTVVPQNLDDSVKVLLDTSKNQLRIRLNDAFGQKLLNTFDTSANNGKLNAYSSDSAFKQYFKGFALRSTGSGNALMGFTLTGNNTKLAIYYRYLHGTSNGDLDTTVAYFRFRSPETYGATGSASHNYIQRTYSGYPIDAAQGGATPDQLVYIQNTPGSFARLKIPALTTIGNRLIHRAELIMEQVYDISDTIFTTPAALHLDAFDPSIPSTAKPFRTIPYDFSYDISGVPNYASFGAYAQFQLDPNSGKRIRVWKFNISRYVQHILTGTSSLYDLRLSSPYSVITQYGIPPTVQDVTQVLFPNPTLAAGRVRLGGGNHPTQKMRLRLIYSKI